MASKPKSKSTMRRRRLVNKLEALLQLDLFRKPDEDTERAIAELRACISTTTRKAG
jgi:hypothetical protein